MVYFTNLFAILSCTLVLQGTLVSACKSDTIVDPPPSSSQDTSGVFREDTSKKNQPRILVFTKTEGFRHKSIPAGVSAIKKLGSKNNFTVIHTENSAVFESDSLTIFDAIIFLNTTGDILNKDQQAAFESFIKSGGGFAGIHSATDTEYDWPWYGQMIGAYFDGHPKVQKATISVVDSNHPSTSFLPDQWTRRDEWYNFKSISSDINVLLNLDESSYKGGTNGQEHPIAWYQEFEGGRIFYTAGGHTKESYSEPLFLKHLLGGIKYVLDSTSE